MARTGRHEHTTAARPLNWERSPRSGHLPGVPPVRRWGLRVGLPGEVGPHGQCRREAVAGQNAGDVGRGDDAAELWTRIRPRLARVMRGSTGARGSPGSAVAISSTGRPPAAGWSRGAPPMARRGGGGASPAHAAVRDHSGPEGRSAAYARGRRGGTVLPTGRRSLSRRGWT